MGVYDRIKQLCKEKGISVRKLEQALGYGNGAMSKLNSAKASYERMSELASYFGVSIDYLTGKTDDRTVKWQEATDFEDDQRVFEGEDDVYWIPLLGRVAAGNPITALEDRIGTLPIYGENVRLGRFFALRVVGDSMEPLIHKGSDVIVMCDAPFENGEICIVQVNGDEATCKRVYKQDDGLLLVSINQEYAPMFYPAEEVIQRPVRILGKVVECRTPIN